jgi:hypothetical protein
MYTKNGGKIYQMDTELSNGHKNVQNSHNMYIFPMTQEYTNLFHSKALKSLPKLGFLV